MCFTSSETVPVVDALDVPLGTASGGSEPPRRALNSSAGAMPLDVASEGLLHAELEVPLQLGGDGRAGAGESEWWLVAELEAVAERLSRSRAPPAQPVPYIIAEWGARSLDVLAVERSASERVDREVPEPISADKGTECASGLGVSVRSGKGVCACGSGGRQRSGELSCELDTSASEPWVGALRRVEREWRGVGLYEDAGGLGGGALVGHVSGLDG